MNRRGFLGAMLALGAAPAIVRASSLMKVVGYEASPAGVLAPKICSLVRVHVPEKLRAGNQLLTIEQITQEALRVIALNVPRTFRVLNTDYAGEFGAGDLITIGG